MYSYPQLDELHNSKIWLDIHLILKTPENYKYKEHRTIVIKSKENEAFLRPSNLSKYNLFSIVHELYLLVHIMKVKYKNEFDLQAFIYFYLPIPYINGLYSEQK